MNNKIVACLVARTNSRRLPLKVLRNIYNNKNLLDVIIDRLKIAQVNSPIINDIYLCTSTEPEDEILEDVAERNDIKYYKGSADEVIERMIAVGDKENADYVIRITGDNVFTDPYILSYQLEYHIKNAFDYSRTEFLPIGVTAEVIAVKALKRCYQSIDPKKSEYLMLYIFDPQKYKCGILLPEKHKYNDYTLTVDTKEDLLRTKKIAKSIGNSFYKAHFLEIIKNIKKYNIVGSYVNSKRLVKLPDDEVVEYNLFRQKIEKKISLSESEFLPADLA